MTDTRICEHGIAYDSDFDNRPDCCEDPEDDGRGEPIPLRMLQEGDPVRWGRPGDNDPTEPMKGTTMKTKHLIAELQRLELDADLPVRIWIGEQSPEYVITSIGTNDAEYDDGGNQISSGPVIIINAEED